MKKIISKMGENFIKKFGKTVNTSSVCLSCGKRLGRNNRRQVTLYCNKDCKGNYKKYGKIK